MESLNLKSSVDAPSNRLWLRTIGLIASFIALVNGLALIFGVIAGLEFIDNMLFLVVGVIGQRILIGPELFTTRVYQKSVEGRDRGAIFFGRRVAVKDRDKKFFSPSFVVRACLLLLLFAVSFRLIMTTGIFNQGFTISGLSVGLSVALILTPATAWIPVGGLITGLIMRGPPSGGSVIPGTIYAVLLLMMIAAFAALLLHESDKESTTQRSSESKIDLTDPTLRSNITWAIVVAIAVYVYCHLAAAKKPKQQTPQPRMPSQEQAAGEAGGGGGGGEGPELGQENRSGERIAGTIDGQSGESYTKEPNSTSEANGNGQGSGQGSGQGAAAKSPAGAHSQTGYSAQTTALSTKTEQKTPKKKRLIAHHKLIMLFAVITAGALIFFWVGRDKKNKKQSAKKVGPRFSRGAAHLASQQLEADAQNALTRWSADPHDIHDRVVSLYNQLLEVNAQFGLKREPEMTPDEYSYLFWSVYPSKASGIQFVTSIYSAVFFGKLRPDQKTFQSYVQAIRMSQATKPSVNWRKLGSQGS